VPVYNGAFRVVEREIVLEDIRRQVAAGARHITFGDPDFFNGPAHAISIVESLHREFPELTYDVTIKIEHLRKHDAHLATLRDTGCLFVTSAVESVDDAVLEKFDKGHTRADFLAVVARFREWGMTLLPTFVPFTPWTTLEGYVDLLDVLAEQGLSENVAPIQLAIRLLIPAGSRLLELPEMSAMIGPFDSAALVFPWKHEDPRVDALAREISQLVQRGDGLKLSRTGIFSHIHRAANAAAGIRAPKSVVHSPAKSVAVPYLDEPWYCCAEPMDDQFVSIGKVKETVAKADQFV
jgi:Radical SAM superfamily